MRYLVLLLDASETEVVGTAPWMTRHTAKSITCLSKSDMMHYLILLFDASETEVVGTAVDGR